MNILGYHVPVSHPASGLGQELMGEVAHGSQKHGCSVFSGESRCFGGCRRTVPWPVDEVISAHCSGPGAGATDGGRKRMCSWEGVLLQSRLRVVLLLACAGGTKQTGGLLYQLVEYYTGNGRASGHQS